MYNDDFKINRTLRKIMTREDIGQHVIALRTHKTRATINNFFQTTTNPTISTVEAIANALNHDIRIQFVRRSDGKIIECE